MNMIHFVNGVGQRPLQDTIPCFDLEASIQLHGRQVESVESKIAGEQVTYSVENDVLTIHLSKLDVWDMLLIQYQ